ncbi:MAG TPA: ComEC/Rec2 family competence protein [Candidatus Methylomirabilis sp.]|nr:ComEC/Rec2 family competence protein [Candidatus Methylomirabilis sp.]
MPQNDASQTPAALATWAAFGYLAGVFIHAGFPFSQTAAWIMAFAVLTGIVAFTRLRSVGIFMLAATLGLLRFDLSIPRGNMPTEFSGKVVEARRYDVVVRPNEGGRIAIPVKRSIGERVHVSCASVKRLDPTNPQSVRDARDGVWFTCKKPDVVHLQSGGFYVNVIVSRWRDAMSRRIRSVLPGDEGALLAGILYGERGLSKDASESFRNAGMTHLIAVSGSNITLVVGLLVPLFVAMGYRRKSAIVLSGFGIFLFVLFVGAQASVVRAALMGWFALLARTFGRKADAARLLAIAATVIVLFDPWALAFDAGFALSFLATWGLIAWARPIAERLSWIPETFGLREIIATTVAATVVTTPYSLWAFERTSLAGLITNLFAIPLVGLTMLWGAVAVALATLLPVAALPVRGCLRAMLGIASLADRLPWLRLAVSLPTWGFFFVQAAMMLIWNRNRAEKVDYPHEPTPFDEKHPFLRAFVRPS